MKIPEITEENTVTLLNTPYINVYDLNYEEGRHYYDVSRKKKENIAAVLNDEEFKRLVPDAVTICVILRMKDADRLLLINEYRYPVGRFLISPPAGLIDKEDQENEDAVFATSVRELYEETGIIYRPCDEFRIISPGLFSSPGMTDECNAISLFIINDPDESMLTDRNTKGTELFDGFILADKEYALDLIRKGRDDKGNLYSIYTWLVLNYFVSDFWK